MEGRGFTSAWRAHFSADAMLQHCDVFFFFLKTKHPFWQRLYSWKSIFLEAPFSAPLIFNRKVGEGFPSSNSSPDVAGEAILLGSDPGVAGKAVLLGSDPGVAGKSILLGSECRIL